MSMDWLSGKPQRICSLHWPPNDPVPASCAGRYYYPKCNVLDDQLLQVFSVKSPEGNTVSHVYLAKLYDAENDQNPVFFVKIAILPHNVYESALLGGRKGFVTLDFAESMVTLRSHTWTGKVTAQKTAPAAVAYGTLVASDQNVAICVSSGNPVPEDFRGYVEMNAVERVDYDSGNLSDLRNLTGLTGDQIIVWDISTDVVERVDIPQEIECPPVMHQPNFQFINQSRTVALGGTVGPSFGRPSAVLRAFSLDDPNGSCRTFTHGENFEMDDDIGVVAKLGSSGKQDVLANYHHSGSRFTVIKPGLLTGDIDSEPDSEDPEGLRHLWSHPTFSRAIEGTLNSSLPSMSQNRLLAFLSVQDGDANGNRSNSRVKAPHDHLYATAVYLYDFDQNRCHELCSLTLHERKKLETQLKDNNADAEVRVVSRNFTAGIEEEEDREFAPGYPPKEWNDHLMELHHLEEARKKGLVETHLLEFDEPPAKKNGNARILYTRSAIWFPPDTVFRTIDKENLALTTSAIVNVPTPGGDGHIFYFSDPS